jgi:6-phosphofructokinase 2
MEGRWPLAGSGVVVDAAVVAAALDELTAPERLAPSDILTVTVNPALDVSMTVDELVPDHKLMAVDHRRDAGGGGINVSRGLVEFGIASTAFVVAGGPIGDELVESVRAAGVPTIHHRIPTNARESIAIGDRTSGSQYRVVVPGPSVPDEREVEHAVLAAARNARLVVLSGRLAPGMSPDFYRRIADALTDRIVVVDATETELACAVEGWATLVKPSRRELAYLVGRSPTGRVEVEGAALEVLRRGRVQALVVSQGSDGVLLATRTGALTWFRPPQVDSVISTVGSGDAMVAGLVAGLVEKRSLRDSVRLGVAAGTASVQTPGTSMGTITETRRLERLVQESPGAEMGS